MNGTDARELLSCALERVERAIDQADRDARLLVLDVHLWPPPLITAVVAVLRRRGRRVKKTTTTDQRGQIQPALAIVFPLAQRELSFN